MTAQVEWHGTQTEQKALLVALANFCTCEEGQPCPGHRMMCQDQATLDRLVFYRRIATRLKQQERSR